MIRHSLYRWLLLIALPVLVTMASSAQTDRSAAWQRWDVTLSDFDLAANRFRVTEEQAVTFTGTFERGTRRIALTNLEDITAIAVRVEGSPLPLDCARTTGAVCVTDENGERVIRYSFPTPITNKTITIIIEYTVVGALRIFPDGDQLQWQAIPVDHSGAIASSLITVELPAALAPREGVDPVETSGAPADIRVNGSIIRAQASRAIAPDEAFSIRAQFPHTAGALAPGWQTSLSSAPGQSGGSPLSLINLAVLALGLLGGVGGGLFWFARSRTRADVALSPTVVPEYLTDPPGDLPPALAALLVRDTLYGDVKAVLGTIVDLAHKGFLRLEETTTASGPKTLTFVRNASARPGVTLLAHEQFLLDTLFQTQNARALPDLNNTFVYQLRPFNDHVVTALAMRGLIDRELPLARYRQRRAARTLLFLALLGGFVGWSVLPPELRGAGIVVALALLANAAALWLFAPPASFVTAKGHEDQAKWRAFRTYLDRIDVYQQKLGLPPANFERYLPYAIAFGAEKRWIAQYSQRPDTPVPDWYLPFPPLVMWDSGPASVPGTFDREPSSTFDFEPTPSSTFDFDPAGALESLSSGMSAALNDISSSFSAMLDSASQALSSGVQSAASGFGDSFGSSFASGGWDSSSSWDSGGSDWSGGDSGGSDFGDSGGGGADFD